MFPLSQVCQSSCMSLDAVRLVRSCFLLAGIGVSVVSVNEHIRGGATPAPLVWKSFRLKQRLEFVNLFRLQFGNRDWVRISLHSHLGRGVWKASPSNPSCVLSVTSGNRAPSIYVAWHKPAPLCYVTPAERVFTIY